MTSPHTLDPSQFNSMYAPSLILALKPLHTLAIGAVPTFFPSGKLNMAYLCILFRSCELGIDLEKKKNLKDYDKVHQHMVAN